MLVDTLPEYRQTISEAFKKKDYTVVSAAAHKLLGAACYCGTLRLEDTARNLEITARKEEKSQIERLVKQLYSEMNAVMKLFPKIQKMKKV